MPAVKLKTVTIGQYKVFSQIKGELRKWQIESVAAHAKVAPSTLYFWLEGRTMFPRIDTLTKVAAVLGFEIVLAKSTKKGRRHLTVVK